MPALRGSYMNRLKLRLLNYALRFLFPVFRMDKVLTASKSGHIFLNGELVTEKRKHSLKAQVRMMRNTELWEILSDTLKHQAQKLAFDDSKDLQDLLNAKMMLYTISVQENIIKKIEEAK